MFFAFQQILKTPTISVIIPCRNGTIELAQCLGALAAAPVPSAEVIVINDGSTEDLRPIVSAAGFPIRLIDMGERQGSSAARNRGARLVAAEVLVFLDADTCVHADTSREVVIQIDEGRRRAHPVCGLIEDSGNAVAREELAAV